MVKEDYKIFVGGLSGDISERQLERGFDRFGKIVESQIMVGRDSGRPRGFGFITYANRRGMEDAIREMHGREFGDRIISVNEALPRGEEIDPPSYRGGYTSGGRGGSFARDGPSAQDECFKCGRLGHWARECRPSAGGGRGGGGPPLSSHSRYGGGGDRFGGERDGYLDDHYDGARYGDRDRFDSREMKYAGRDLFVNDRYPPAGDRFGTDRYGGSDRYPLNGFSKDRGYDRDPLPRGGGDMYGGGGPVRAGDRSYRSRAGPYGRPPRGVRGSSFERY